VPTVVARRTLSGPRPRTAAAPASPCHLRCNIVNASRNCDRQLSERPSLQSRCGRTACTAAHCHAGTNGAFRLLALRHLGRKHHHVNAAEMTTRAVSRSTVTLVAPEIALQRCVAACTWPMAASAEAPSPLTTASMSSVAASGTWTAATSLLSCRPSSSPYLHHCRCQSGACPNRCWSIQACARDEKTVLGPHAGTEASRSGRLQHQQAARTGAGV